MEKEAQEKLNQLDKILGEKQEKLRPTLWNYLFWNPFTQTFWNKFPEERRKLYKLYLIAILITLIFLIYFLFMYY